MTDQNEKEIPDVVAAPQKGRKSKLQNDSPLDKELIQQITNLNNHIQQLEMKNAELNQQLNWYKKSFHDDGDKRILKRSASKKKRFFKKNKTLKLPEIPSVCETKKQRYRKLDIPSLIDYVMESGYYRVSQAIYIFNCINEHLPDEILWRLADPHYTAGLMEMIKDVMMMYRGFRNEKDVLCVLNKILCDEKMSNVQQCYLLSLLLNGDPAQLVESIACAAYPLALMKSLREYKSRKLEGETKNGEL